MVGPNNAGPSGECPSDIPICGSGSVGGTDAMRSWAWRQWGLGALDFCDGAANTTIVHTTILAPQHDFSRSHVALSSPMVAGREGAHVRSTRREAIDGCGREGENLRASKAHRRARSVPVRRSGQRTFTALSGSSNPEARSCQVARRRGSHWPDRPRCLKRSSTSLEAIGPPQGRVGKRCARRIRCAEASVRVRALCRGLPDHVCELIQEDGLSVSSGWLRRSG
jgi:hypothetical protein